MFYDYDWKWNINNGKPYPQSKNKWINNDKIVYL